MDLVNQILKWPVIIQGALGSFLFWLIFNLGQKGSMFLLSKLKSENELGKSFARLARESFHNKIYPVSNYAFFVSIYAAMHYLLEFVIASFIALLVSNFIPVFAYIGYALAFYFLFRALSYVPHFATFESEEKKATESQEKEST